MIPTHLHWDILLGVLMVLGAYGYLLARWRPTPQWFYPIESKQVASFTLGLAFIVAMQATPFHDLSERSFSVHMVQHLVLTLAVPPLLLLGLPGWLLKPLVKHPILFKIAGVLTHPVFAMGSFNATLAFWHIPMLYDLAVWDYNIHLLNHGMYLFTGILLWWPIFSPLPELPRLNYPLQMMYLFVQSLVPAVLASIITFADDVAYVAYKTAQPIWHWSILEDQQIGGLIMKVGGGAILWALAIAIFFTWFTHEESEIEKSWD